MTANSNDEPLVSVIIPLYNVRPYLDKCIASAVNQTYRNLEILLIDDGSTDGSAQICDTWAQRDARITAFHTANGGIATARNYGLDHATGDFIYWMDSDDWIDDDLIATAVATSLDTDSDIVCFEYNSVSADASVVRVSDDAAKFPSERRCTPEQALELMWTDQVQNFLWAFIAKRSLYDGLRFGDGLVMEDMGITYRLYEAANAIYYVPKPLYYYRVRKTSLLGEKSALMPRSTLHFVPIVTDYALTHYPRLKTIVLNWAVRYLSGAVIWAYQGRRNFTTEEYRQFNRRAKQLLDTYIRACGIINLTKTNLIKTVMIQLHCMWLVDAISRRRSERKA